MLHRLRRHMALLNAAISGTILLAMALIALGISDSTIEQRYEADLADSSANLLSVMTQPVGGAPVAFTTTSDLMLYYERDGKTLVAGRTAVSEKEQLAPVVATVRAKVADKLQEAGNEQAIPEGGGGGDILFQRVLIATHDAGQSFDINMARDPSQGGEAATRAAAYSLDEGDGAVAVTSVTRIDIAQVPNLLVDADGKSFRVTATSLDGAETAMLMVMQDRAAELAERAQTRWLFFGLAMGGLLLVGCASLFLSARAIEPVEASIAQQRAFVASASHELRTPVAALCANAEVLQDADLGEFAPFLESIQIEGGRMTHLVRDLIDLARADAGELQFVEEYVAADEVAMKTLAAMRPLAERKGIELTADLERAWIRGDHARLQQALVALLDNAIRYTPQGGHVKVKVCVDKQKVTIAVIDDGPGIPDEHKPRVFERFYRVDVARTPDGGSGLGLSVARQIVERMSGTIALRDGENGAGCTFEMKWKPAR